MLQHINTLGQSNLATIIKSSILLQKYNETNFITKKINSNSVNSITDIVYDFKRIHTRKHKFIFLKKVNKILHT